MFPCETQQETHRACLTKTIVNGVVFSTALLAFLAWCAAVSFIVIEDDDDEKEGEGLNCAGNEKACIQVR